MIFNYVLNIPANTPANEPVREIYKATYGLIYRIEILFPAGCAGLAYLRVLDGGHQVYPSNQGAYFNGDNNVVAFDDTLLSLVEPFEYVLEGYNLDTLFEHNIYVRLGIADKDIYMARFLPSITWDKLIEALKKEKSLQQSASSQSLQDLTNIFG